MTPLNLSQNTNAIHGFTGFCSAHIAKLTQFLLAVWNVSGGRESNQQWSVFFSDYHPSGGKRAPEASCLPKWVKSQISGVALVPRWVCVFRNRKDYTKDMLSPRRGACALTTEFLDNKVCTFKVLLSWRFRRNKQKSAFLDDFLSAPQNWSLISFL